MTEADMQRLAELAQEFYNEKQEESGMAEPIKKAWASNEDEGLLIVVSTFGVHSRDLAKQTGIPWKGSQPKEEAGGQPCGCLFATTFACGSHKGLVDKNCPCRCHRRI